jgi:hypothetical protein
MNIAEITIADQEMRNITKQLAGWNMSRNRTTRMMKLRYKIARMKKMTKTEQIQVLIEYLHALAEVQKGGEIRVFAEMKRTIEKLEKLLNN